MANKRGKVRDTSFLSLDNARERGFLHRDYLAHCMRWAHVVKFLLQGQRFKECKLLDVGCGKELPLIRTMYSSRIHPKLADDSGAIYVGVDVGNIEYENQAMTAACSMLILPNTQFGDDSYVEKFGAIPGITDGGFFNVITSFEVMEHVEPSETLRMLQDMEYWLHEDGTAFISTPCFDINMGAADNHVSEYSYDAFAVMIRMAGFDVEQVYGTFASQRHYLPHLNDWQTSMFEALSEYYDSNTLSIIMAPLVPQYSRNCLWRLRKKGTCTAPIVNTTRIVDIRGHEHCSSAVWQEFVYSIGDDDGHHDF